MASALHEARASQPRPPPLPHGRVHGIVIDEKAPQDAAPTLRSSSHTTSISHPRRRATWWRLTMPSFRHGLSALLVVVFFTMVFAAAPVMPKPWRFSWEVRADDLSFKDLLSSVSDDALHEVLHHMSDKYKHGVYPEDRAAIEAIHKDSPALAQGLVELARRQKSNATTTAAAIPPTTSVVVVVPTTSVVVVQASSQAAPPTTTAQAAASTTPPQVSNSAPPATTASQQGDTTQTTIPVITVTSAAVVTSTANAPSPSGLTTITTTTKPLSSTTKEVVFVTTFPNGSPSTVTSFTIVAASDQPTPAVGPAVANPSVTPSLQNGATDGRGPKGMGLAGAIIVALIFVVAVL